MKFERQMVFKMVALFYLLLGFRHIKCQILEEIDPEFQDINDLFPAFTNSPSSTVLNKPPNVIIRNISIDLEKIDMKKFNKKIERYRTKFANFDKDAANWTLRYNEARRMPYYGYDVSRTEWDRAQQHIVKTKCLDMSLQLIYMARHKIRQLENMRYFNRHDTSYRIAFLYRRIRKIWKKLMDIMTTLRKRRLDTDGPFGWVRAYLVLHHKAVILHVDFVYMWWVLVNLHDKFKIAHFIPNTPPPTTKAQTTQTPLTNMNN